VRQVVLQRMQQHNYSKKEALPGLIACLSDQQPYVKQQACNLLAVLGKDAAEAVEPLRKLATDSNPQVAAAAQAALNAIAPPKK